MTNKEFDEALVKLKIQYEFRLKRDLRALKERTSLEEDDLYTKIKKKLKRLLGLK
jgi:hypothetical protein